jgi:hypothetical protein
VLEHEQDAVLSVGHAQLAGFLDEQRHGNLVHAPDHEARTSIQLFQRIVLRGCHF